MCLVYRVMTSIRSLHVLEAYTGTTVSASIGSDSHLTQATAKCITVESNVGERTVPFCYLLSLVLLSKLHHDLL
jgi:hypothetical protein